MRGNLTYAHNYTNERRLVGLLRFDYETRKIPKQVLLLTPAAMSFTVESTRSHGLYTVAEQVFTKYFKIHLKKGFLLPTSHQRVK